MILPTLTNWHFATSLSLVVYLASLQLVLPLGRLLPAVSSAVIGYALTSPYLDYNIQLWAVMLERPPFVFVFPRSTYLYKMEDAKWSLSYLSSTFIYILK